MQATTNDLSTAWRDLAGAAQILMSTVTGHVARLVGDVASTARATPRLARLCAEGLRIFALHRLEAAKLAALGQSDAAGQAAATARRVRELCIELRGGVLKLGQLVSSRIDLLPPAAIAELVQLQDRVPSLPDEVIRAHVEAELGRPLDEVFQSFGPALAAASLAQVHEAVLIDGTEVAVKVLVPGIESVVEADLRAARVLAASLADWLPGVDLGAVAAELGRAIAAELSLVDEAAALDAFAARLAGDTRVVLPAPILAARRVLVMERLRGERLPDFLARAEPADRDRVVATLVDCFSAQILEHGAFHADPHPGNFLVLPDGRVALLDFGCVQSLDDDTRRAYAGLVMAVLGRDAARAGALLGQLGFVSRTGDPAALHELAELILAAMRPGADLRAFDPRAQLERALALLQQNPIASVPHHFVLVGRVLASLGGIAFAYPPATGLFAILAPRLARAAA